MHKSAFIKVLTITLTVLLTLLTLLMVTISISIKLEYWGQEMGRDAFGYFSTAIIISLILSIPTIILWIMMIKRIKKIPVPHKL